MRVRFSLAFVKFKRSPSASLLMSSETQMHGLEINTVSEVRADEEKEKKDLKKKKKKEQRTDLGCSL